MGIPPLYLFSPMAMLAMQMIPSKTMKKIIAKGEYAHVAMDPSRSWIPSRLKASILAGKMLWDASQCRTVDSDRTGAAYPHGRDRRCVPTCAPPFGALTLNGCPLPLRSANRFHSSPTNILVSTPLEFRYHIERNACGMFAIAVMARSPPAPRRGLSPSGIRAPELIWPKPRDQSVEMSSLVERLWRPSAKRPPVRPRADMQL
jgi:hypothetical protein